MGQFLIKNFSIKPLVYGEGMIDKSLGLAANSPKVYRLLKLDKMEVSFSSPDLFLSHSANVQLDQKGSSPYDKHKNQLKDVLLKTCSFLSG